MTDPLVFEDRRPFNAARLNEATRALDLRLRGLEGVQVDARAAVEELRRYGLARLDEAMAPVYERLVEIAHLGVVFTATSATAVVLGTGVRSFVLAQADRQRFAPAASLGAQSAADPGVGLYGSLQSYDAATGVLSILVGLVEGDPGETVSSWIISAVPGSVSGAYAAAQAAAAAASAGIATTKAAEVAANTATVNTKAAEAAANTATVNTKAAEVAANAATVTTKAAEVADTAAEVASVYDLFDDRFLGAKSSPPTTDNDGATLLVGALYFDTGSSAFRAWTGTAWVDPAVLAPANASIANTKLANMVTARIKGRNTAGTGSPEDLTGAQVTGMLVAMAGDAGTGGAKGLVPAQAAGDADRVLFGDATFKAVLRPGTTASIVTGYTFVPYSLGVVTSGTITPNPTQSNHQYLVNNGTFTLAAWTNVDSDVDLDIINGPSAGAITLTGFQVGSNPGDAFATASRASSTATITIASPGVVTWNAHGIRESMPVWLTTTGALPTGLTASTVYFARAVTANSFQLAATPRGAAINTTGTQSGTHTAYAASVYKYSMRCSWGVNTHVIKALQ